MGRSSFSPELWPVTTGYMCWVESGGLTLRGRMRLGRQGPTCVLNTRTSKYQGLYRENSLLKYLSLNVCQWLIGLCVGRYGYPIDYNL